MAISRHNLVPDLPDNNFATLNPSCSFSSQTFSQGNLKVETNVSGYETLSSTISFPVGFGKWYIEVFIELTTGYECYGIVPSDYSTSLNEYPGELAGSYGYLAWVGKKQHSGGSATSYGQTFGVNGNLMGLLFDAENGTLEFFKNGVSQGVAFTSISTTKEYIFGLSDYHGSTSGTYVVNFGQNPDFCGRKTDYSGGDNPDGSWSDANGIGRFHYQPPAGALALCSRNLQPAVSFAGYDFEETGKALTYSGNAKISKNSPYMRGSYYLDGSGDYLQAPTNPNFSPAGDFTIEGWYYLSNMSSSHYLFGTGTSTGNEHIAMRINADNAFGIYLRKSPDAINNVSSGATNFKKGVWNHVVLERYGNEIKVYLNGKCVFTYDASAWTPHTSNQPFSIGRFGEYAGAYWNGYIADFRFVSGTAVYQGEFTPPTEPVAITDDTVLHLGSNSITSYGNTKFVPTSPFNTPSKQRENALTSFGGGSFETGASLADHTDVVIPGGFPDGPLTIQCWIYAKSLSGWNAPFGNTRGDTGWNFGVHEDGMLSTYSQRAGLAAFHPYTKNVIRTKTWHHVAFTINPDGSGCSWVDGKKYEDFDSDKTFSGFTDPNFQIAKGGVPDANSQYFDGYIADIEITKEVKYPSNQNTYTIPTEPATATENTVFLAQPYRMKKGVGNMSIASRPLTDETGKAFLYDGDVLTSAESPISGLGSFEFNQSGLTFEQSVLQGGAAFGTGDFTIEFWLYMDDIMSQNYWCLCDTRALDGDAETDAFGFFIRGSAETPNGAFYVYCGGNHLFGQVAKDRTWHHVALVRESNSLNCFLDGNPGSPVTFTNNLSATNDFAIGWPPFNPANYRLNGKMSDIRVVKGEALYTSNFNPFNRPASADISTGTVVLDLSPKVSLSAAENPEQHFKAVNYIGTGGGQVDPVEVGFQPDLVWIKNRDTTNSHNLYDSVRTTADGPLLSDTTDKSDGIERITFSSNGFNRSSSDYSYTNSSNENYIAWCWKAAGAPADNTANIIDADGSLITMLTADLKNQTGASITPAKVSANRKSGFSIVKWTQPASGSYTIPNALDNPDFKLFKATSTNNTNWYVQHSSYPGDTYAVLNTTQTTQTSGTWSIDNDSSGKLTTVGSGWPSYIGAADMIMYCWKEIPGYSKFGSYVGTASGRPYINLGFRPAFIMIKAVDDNGYNSYQSWTMMDTARSPYNPDSGALYANAAWAEGTSGNGSGSESGYVDILSNGFKIRTGSAAINGIDNIKHIYAAFAEVPLNFANAR